MTAPRPSPATRPAQAAILDATERLLATRGFSELSVSDVIAEAGVSRTSFYAHFGSRAAVLAACLRRFIGELPTAAELGPPPPGDPSATVRVGLTRWIALAADHGPLMRTASEQWPHDPELRDLWCAAMGALADGLRAAIVRARVDGEAPPGADPAALAAVLTWGCERVLHVALVGDALGLDDLEATVEPLVALVSAGAFGHVGDVG